jgi:hypothetical protein
VKLHEEFDVAKPVAAIWTFFEQPEKVAQCVPGVEQLTVVDADNVNVRLTQSIGPMTATFDAKVKIVERVSGELMRFTATGRSVRGAMGNVRASNTVHLTAVDGGTRVRVEGDVTLAGALGSVGQKVVASQASKVTAQFARNLETVLNGGQVEDASRERAGTKRAPSAPASAAPAAPSTTAPAQSLPPVSELPPLDPWPRAAAALSAVSVVLSLLALLRSRRAAR